MKGFVRSICFFCCLGVCCAAGSAAFAQTTPQLEVLPYSGAVLVSRAIKAGRIHLGTSQTLSALGAESETCSTAPCALPNVDIFPSPKPVNETPIVVNPLNSQQLLSGANDYNCQYGFTSFSTSDDAGSTWTHHCMDLLNGVAPFIGDPGVAYDLLGNAYASSIDGYLTQIGYQKSTDNGKTWLPPQVVDVTHPGYFMDKPWMQIDTNPNSAFKNSIYVSNTEFDVQTESKSRIVLNYSHDGGQTWQSGYVGPLQTTNVDQFSDIATDADGTVYLTWQRCTPLYNPWFLTDDCGGTVASYYLIKSTDGGQSWTEPQLMFQAQLNLDSCGCAFYGNVIGMYERVSNIPVISVDTSSGPYKGRLYVVYYNWTGSFNINGGIYTQGQMQINIASSVDGGTTWTSKLLTPVDDTTWPGTINGVNFDLKNQFFPWLSVSKQGTVGVTWLDTRNDEYDQNYDEYATFSTNGGKTFSAPIRLSTESSNPFKDGFGGQFIGDYTGNAWGPGGVRFYTAYTSTTAGIDQDFLVGYVK